MHSGRQPKLKEDIDVAQAVELLEPFERAAKHAFRGLRLLFQALNQGRASVHEDSII